MNESLAITIMNDIIKNSKTDTEILNRTQELISMVHLHELTKLSYLYVLYLFYY